MEKKKIENLDENKEERKTRERKTKERLLKSPSTLIGKS